MGNRQHRPDASMPVSVLMERCRIERGPWAEMQWRVARVIPSRGAPDTPIAKTLIHSGEGREEYLWTGHRVELFKDGAEGYWYNLLSDPAYLFVVCYAEGGEGDDAQLAPCLVTPNQDEANAHLESEDRVFSTPMPPELCDWVERFVVEHYVPEEKRKRKRRNWTQEDERAPPRARRD